MKKINENNGQRMRAAKQVREQLGGGNFHQKQWKGISDTIDRNQGIHMISCYMKFSLILFISQKNIHSKEIVLNTVNFFRINIHMDLSGRL